MRVAITPLLFLCILLILSHKLSAQSVKEQFTHRIGLGVPYIPVTGSFKGYTPALNVSYKAGKNKNLIRSGASHWFGHNSFTSTFNAGYERRFFNGKFQLLAGADIGLRYYQESSGVATMHYKNSVLNYGVGPVLGVSYKPFDRIYFESEWSMFIGPGREKHTYIYSTINRGSYATAHRWFSIHIYYQLK